MVVLLANGEHKEITYIEVTGRVNDGYDIWYIEAKSKKYHSCLVEETEEVIEIERKIRESIEEFSKVHEYGQEFMIKLYYPKEED